MPQRLPTLGESPYKTILDGFLEVTLDTAGALRTTLTPTFAGLTLTGDQSIAKTAPAFTLDGTGITSASLYLRTNSTTRWQMYVPSASTDLRFNDGSADRVTLAAGGTLTIPALVITGLTTILQINASNLDFAPATNIQANRTAGIFFTGNPSTLSGAVTGDIAIPQGNSYRATTSGASLILLRSSSIGGVNYVQLGNQTIAAIGVPDTMVGAGIGDLVVANTKGVRSGNFAGSTTIRMIDVSGGASNIVIVGGDGAGAIGVGAIATGTGSAANDLIIQNNASLRFTQASGTNTSRVLHYDGSNNLKIGEDGNVLIMGAPASIVSAVAGDIVFGNGLFLRAANNAGNGTVPLIGAVTSTNLVQVGGAGATAQIVIIGTPASTSGASTGDLVLANNRSVDWTNNAGSAVIGGISFDTADRITLNANSKAVSVVGPLTQTTIGANGAASALTANPVGYLTVRIGGIDRIIPYYNV